MRRKVFIKKLSLAGILSILKPLTFYGMEKNDSKNILPVFFFGHGSPMNIIADNDFTRKLRKFGETLIKPKAILCISAHWLTEGSYVLNSKTPKMIYDMYGFPDELYHFKYNAPGAPKIAENLCNHARIVNIQKTEDWGFDHGCYSILTHLFPQANVPVVQLSIDYHKPMLYHFNLAREINFLRKNGVMVIASGNITHNLRKFEFSEQANTVEWAQSFDEKIKKAINIRDFNSLFKYESLGKEAELAVPEPSHYIPLMYALGMMQDKDNIKMIYEGFHHGTISMRSFQIG